MSEDTASLLRESIGSYIHAIESYSGQTIDTRVTAYLKLIPEYPLGDVLLLGQEPYESSLLPPIASAFAYDILNPVLPCPPTVTTTAQFILAGSKGTQDGLTMPAVASILSCSYVLLPVGVMFLNAHCIKTSDVALQVRMESAFAELCCTLIYCASLSGKASFKLLHFGDVAQRTISLVMGALRADKLGKTKVSHTKHRFPVYLDRAVDSQYRGSELRCDKSVNAAAHAATSIMSNPEASTATSSCLLRHLVLAYDYTRYLPGQLAILGNNSTVQSLFSKRVANKLTTITSEFVSALPLAIMSYSSYGHGGGSRKYAPVDTVDKRVELLTRISVKQATLGQQMEKVIADVQSASEALNAEDADSVASYLSALRALHVKFSMSTAFYASIPGILTSTESAITSVGNNIGPHVIATGGVVNAPPPSGGFQQHPGSMGRPLARPVGIARPSTSAGPTMHAVMPTRPVMSPRPQSLPVRPSIVSHAGSTAGHEAVDAVPTSSALSVSSELSAGVNDYDVISYHEDDLGMMAEVYDVTNTGMKFVMGSDDVEDVGAPTQAGTISHPQSRPPTPASPSMGPSVVMRQPLGRPMRPALVRPTAAAVATASSTMSGTVAPALGRPLARPVHPVMHPTASVIRPRPTSLGSTVPNTLVTTGTVSLSRPLARPSLTRPSAYTTVPSGNYGQPSSPQLYTPPTPVSSPPHSMRRPLVRPVRPSS